MSKELSQRLYEEKVDANPSVEPYLELTDTEGKIGRIPLPAYVHEIGKFVDVNCCLTTWCKNYSKSCIAIPENEDDLSKATKLADGYVFEIEKDYDVKNLTITKLKCDLCKYCTKVRSNRGTSELISCFIRKDAPALFCDKCSSDKINEDGKVVTDYEWDYGTPNPNKFFGIHTRWNPEKGNELTRFKCNRCERKKENGKKRLTTKTPYFRDVPDGISNFVRNPEETLSDMDNTVRYSVNEYKRSSLYMEREVPSVRPTNTRAGGSYYYTNLRKFQFFAVEWNGYFNNLIRFGDKEMTIQHRIHERKSALRMARKRARERAQKIKMGIPVDKEDAYKSKIMKGPALDQDNNPLADASHEVNGERNSVIKEAKEEQVKLLTYPEDIHAKDLKDFHRPQIQTDVLLVSIKTPGSKDRRQQFRLMISVLHPSEYVLLATLDYSDQHNLDELDELDERAVAGLEDVDLYGKDRELSMHPQMYKKWDIVHSPDRKGEGPTHVRELMDKGARIREMYHANAHYYALEKIAANIPELTLVLDNEIVPLKSCVWAFSDRIKKGNCHVITTKKMDYEPEESEGKTREELMSKLEQEVDEMKQQDWSDKWITTGKTPLPGFTSKLFTEYLGEGKNSKRKIWVTKNTLTDVDSKSAALMLRAASLSMVDSMCNQMRSRIEGATRGKKNAGQSGRLSYISHFEDPMNFQQHVDIFVFSKNCLSGHSNVKDYAPGVVQLKLSVENMHLIHFVHTKSILHPDFLEKKYCYKDDKAKQSSKCKGKRK